MSKRHGKKMQIQRSKLGTNIGVEFHGETPYICCSLSLVNNTSKSVNSLHSTHIQDRKPWAFVWVLQLLHKSRLHPT